MIKLELNTGIPAGKIPFGYITRTTKRLKSGTPTSIMAVSVSCFRIDEKRSVLSVFEKDECGLYRLVPEKASPNAIPQIDTWSVLMTFETEEEMSLWAESQGKKLIRVKMPWVL